MSRWREPAQQTSIWGVALGLSAAYAVWRRERVTFMPEFGFRVLALDMKTPLQAPALAIQPRRDLPNRLRFESAALILDFALRSEIRVLRVGSTINSFAYLTLGSYLGWEQQVVAGGWSLIESDAELKVTQPRVNRSGPLGLIYVGWVFERMR